LAHNATDTGDRDDTAAALAAHVRKNLSGQTGDAGEVDIHRPRQVGITGLLKRADIGSTSIVHQHIEGAVFRDHIRDDLFDRRCVGYIERHDLNGDAGKDVKVSEDRDSGLGSELDGDDDSENAELNNTNTREGASLAAKRGRQPRRGSTAQVVADQQEYWGDNASGNDEGGDEGSDEDEDPDVTMPSN
jgi:hypothetical protein